MRLDQMMTLKKNKQISHRIYEVGQLAVFDSTQVKKSCPKKYYKQ